MTLWDDPRARELLDRNQGHVRILCDSRHALTELVLSHGGRRNLELILVDQNHKTSYRFHASSHEPTRVLPLVDQDQCFARARSMARDFEAVLMELMKGLGLGTQYARYRPLISNWAFPNLSRAALVWETLEICNATHGRPQMTVLAMDRKLGSVAAELVGSECVLIGHKFSSTPKKIPAPRRQLRILLSKVRNAVRNTSNLARLWYTAASKVKRIIRMLSNKVRNAVRNTSNQARLWYTAASEPNRIKRECSEVLTSPQSVFATGPATLVVAIKGASKLHIDTVLPVIRRLNSARGALIRTAILDMRPSASQPNALTDAFDDRTPNVPVYPAHAFQLVDYQRAAIARMFAYISRQIQEQLQNDRRKRDELLAKGLTPVLIRILITRLFNFDFPLALALSGGLRNQFSQSGRTLLLTCTDSHWLTDAARLAAREAEIPQISVQNAYMSRSPRYSPPQGDLITAIDTWSRDLMREHFACDPQAIWLVGTPRFDPIANLADAPLARKELSLADIDGVVSGRPVVCFAAQDERLTVSTSRIMRQLAAVQIPTGPLTIIIKLHPTATAEFAEKLKAAAAQFSTPHTIVILGQYDVHKLLRACDVLVTVSSNVGIEAAIIGKDIVIANLENRELSPPLDEFDIGLVAQNDAELVDAVEAILNSPGQRAALAAKRQRYRRENAQLFAGRSAELIARHIESLLAGIETVTSQLPRTDAG